MPESTSPDTAHLIADNIRQVQTRISEVADSDRTIADNNRGIVQLIAVSKTRSAEEVRIAYDCGLRHFGENYLQEALAKVAALQPLGITWHFIGPIQSNKTADIAAHFDWAHSVDRLKIGQRLSAQRPDGLPPLNLCIQVNIDQEASKSGVSLAELPALAAAIAELPKVKLRGLMAIPAAGRPLADTRASFARLRQAMEQLNQQGFNLDTLSMGMSNDLECAVGEGATFIRIGTAIFGPRPAKN